MRKPSGCLGAKTVGGLEETVTVWAGALLLLSDEFRQGNVLASKDIKRAVDEACDTLPPGEWQVKVRSEAVACEGDCWTTGMRRAGALP